jgi:hypothetical protein
MSFRLAQLLSATLRLSNLKLELNESRIYACKRSVAFTVQVKLPLLAELVKEISNVIVAQHLARAMAELTSSTASATARNSRCANPAAQDRPAPSARLKVSRIVKRAKPSRRAISCIEIDEDFSRTTSGAFAHPNPLRWHRSSFKVVKGAP